MLNPELKIGDRVLLIHMDGESSVTIGMKGTVKSVSNDPFEDNDKIYMVDWDNGNSLNLLSVTDSWILDTEKESLKEQKLPSSTNPCESLGEGKEFCKKLQTILKSGRGGKGAKLFKQKSYKVFGELREKGFGDENKTEVLVPGNPLFDTRINELKEFFGVLTKYSACSKMRNEIKKDIINVKNKGLKMVVDSSREYSILNRIDTHYSAQAYLMSLLAVELGFLLPDTYDNDQIIDEVDLFILSRPDRIRKKIEEIIGTDEFEKLSGTLEYSSMAGDRTEMGVVNKLRKMGYEVYNYSTDFGFVDHFGVDMLVVKDGKVHPVQVSTSRKFNPEIAKFNDSDCECWMIYKDRNTNTFRKETIFEQTKKDLINKIESNDIEMSILDDLIGQLSDEDITDLFLRNLDRKFLKGGDKQKNVRDYITKYINSLGQRPGGVEQDDDFSVDDEFLYGGIEPEKSKIGKKRFKNELLPLQVELLKLQEHVKKTGKPVVIVFEGRDSAGKGSVIKQMTEYLDPKYYNVIALGIPTPEEKKDWFGRYEKEIESGKINFFDRSWYNRGIVEPVMGYSSEEEYQDFMDNVNDFEKSLIEKGIELIKFWLSITPETQKKRFALRQASPLKYWKFSPNDEASIDKWDDYTEYKNKVIKHSKEAKPWTIVDSNDKRVGILNAFRHLLTTIDYQGKDDKNIGMVYPEVVTTIKEKEMVESSSVDIDNLMSMQNIFRSGKGPKIFNFFEKVRQSGIVNTLESSRFVYSGGEYLRDFIKMREYDGYEYDSDMVDELATLADDAKNTLIGMTFDLLESKGMEPTLDNMNREIKKLATEALRYFITIKSI